MASVYRLTVSAADIMHKYRICCSTGFEIRTRKPLGGPEEATTQEKVKKIMTVFLKFAEKLGERREQIQAMNPLEVPYYPPLKKERDWSAAKKLEYEKVKQQWEELEREHEIIKVLPWEEPRLSWSS
jgi:hypothetical protein